MPSERQVQGEADVAAGFYDTDILQKREFWNVGGVQHVSCGQTDLQTLAQIGAK